MKTVTNRKKKETIHFPLLEDWKYDSRIKKHYLETDETGELTKRYRQSEEHEESDRCDQPLKKKKLNAGSRDPLALEDEEPECDQEKQDRLNLRVLVGCSFSLFHQDPGELMQRTMDALLARSAKMLDMAQKVEGKADTRRIQHMLKS